jgi:type IV pilus assembly protein PilB
VTHAVVADVAASEQHLGKAVERALIDEGLLKEETVLAIMSELFKLRLVSLTPDILDSRLADELPQRMLENFCVYPLLREPGSEVLPLATVDPFDITAADTFHQVTGRAIQFVLAPRAQIEHAIQGKTLSSEGLRMLADDVPELPEWEGLESLLEEETNELSENAAPIVRLVNSILKEAIRRKASDIHIEPQEKSFRVRYRLDGLLRTIVELPKRAEKTCVSRIKIMSGMDITSSRSSQDGRMSLRVNSLKVNMRVSTIASYYGEKIVLRILDQSSVALNLTDLGLSSADLVTLTEHFKASYGMVLITGPTGSGKTSTLYAALRLINSPTVNIVTVEDPIEYQLDGLTQVQTNPKAGITFASALRTFLRQDPDVILVGEIRDTETAKTAIAAAQSGHLVMSTLHANDSPGTLARLVMMGIEPHQISGSLLCVVAQRLVRRLCSHCRAAVDIKPEQSRLLSLALEGRLPKKLFAGRGCPECDGSGFRGRLGLYEILTVTSSIREQMMEDPSEEALWRIARQEGMTTLLEDGIAKVEQGLTSLDEVLRVVTIKRKPGNPETKQQEAAMPTVARPLAIPRTVRQTMTREVISIAPETPLTQAAQILLVNKITGAPVVDRKGALLGVLSFSDVALARPRGKKEKTPTAREAMSAHVITVSPDDSLATAAQRMWRHKVHRLMVVEDQELVGVLTPFDLMLRTSLFSQDGQRPPGG